jgi:uncharacterized protein YdhG (YjbR/CyaY superfamily)
MAGKTEPAGIIDQYLASLPDDVRAALGRLRSVIRAAAPGAVEAISYSLPAFKYKDRPLVSYAASKNHMGFYVMSPTVIENMRDELSGYDTSKGTIRFTAGKQLPAALVKRLVKARVRETDALSKMKENKK